MIPCKGCLLKAVCKYKYFSDLIKDCILVDKFLHNRNPGHEEIVKRMIIVSKILNPIMWEAHE